MTDLAPITSDPSTSGVALYRDRLDVGLGIDDDGDGEDLSPVNEFGEKVADGEDNNGNGKIDEGIDEEIKDGLDNDGDGKIDEDIGFGFPLEQGENPLIDWATSERVLRGVFDPGDTFIEIDISQSRYTVNGGSLVFMPGAAQVPEASASYDAEEGGFLKSKLGHRPKYFLVFRAADEAPTENQFAVRIVPNVGITYSEGGCGEGIVSRTLMTSSVGEKPTIDLKDPSKPGEPLVNGRLSLRYEASDDDVNDLVRLCF